jgi:hypothetical protein
VKRRQAKLRQAKLRQAKLRQAKRRRASPHPRKGLTVIPAKAGIHFYLPARAKWIPAFAGMTDPGRKAIGFRQMTICRSKNGRGFRRDDDWRSNGSRLSPG